MRPTSVVVLGPTRPEEFASHLGVDWAPPGMGGTPVNELIRGLLALDLSISLVTTCYSINQAWLAARGPLRIHVVPARARPRDRARDLFAAERKGLVAAVASAPGDVIHAHWTYEFAWAALDDGRPTVVTARDAPITILRHFRDPYRVVRTAMAATVRRRIRHLTAVSPYLAERWRKEMLFRGPIDVIPNATPEDVFYGIGTVVAPKCPPVILEVADASRRKNVAGLLRAFAEVRRRFADAHLRLVGPGLDATGLVATWAKAEGLEVGVTYLGPLRRDELRSEFEGATVFAHASLEESFGMVLLEAMGSGVPVIAGHRSGGIPWVLGHGRAGLLVDVQDPHAFGQAIADLLADRGRRAELAHEGRLRATRHFSLDRVTAMYLDVYQRALIAR
jgi:glycosyltransferase involved in cell wall biosynthesis